ncbi:MAG TPA: type II toxin-antitoxin system Phd/YefM family antitoxin [Dehalococcoidales bacterium]|nr:type II toxin-antitoxin system Phd/YefM family antitoxin [Dehalococcoidales bacterium]
MLAANPSDIRKNLKDYMDKVVDDNEPLIITRPGGRDVVMLSKEEYDNIIENIHVLGNKANREWLLLGKKQAEAGNLKEVKIE